MSDPMLSWRANYSNISKYEQCPYKFKLLVRDGRKDLFQPPSAALAFGTSVHSALHQFFLLPSPERTEQRLLELLQSAFIKEFRGIEKSETLTMWDRGKKAMRLFAAREDITLAPLFLEEFLYVNLPEFTISGKIDRGHRDPDGVHHIVDYKTGTGLHDRMQLLIYAILGSNHLSVDELRVSFLYVEREVDRWMTCDVDAAFVDNAIAEVRDKVAVMKSDRDFVPRPGPLCDWCECLRVCDSGKDYLANTPSIDDLSLD